MYEDRTQQNILRELLESTPSDCNKQEGTLIYAPLAAEAEKIEDIYIEIATNYDNCMADTADREHLIRRAKERGLTPKQATSALYRAEFNCSIRVGERFWQGKYHFKVTEKIADKEYKIQCEETGIATNNLFGKIEPVEYIEEFETGSIIELLIPAEDEQSTEDFREEYFSSVSSPNFSGNISFYVKEVGKIDGVGYCKPIPLTTPFQMIECVIIDSEWKEPTNELVQKVQNIVDPETDINNIGKEYGLPELSNYKGLGYGIAPIFHNVIVRGVVNHQIEIYGRIEFKEGFNENKIVSDIFDSIEKYFNELAADWRNTTQITVRSSYIISYILSIDGVLDVYDISIGKEENIRLEYDEIPKLEGVYFE